MLIHTKLLQLYQEYVQRTIEQKPDAAHPLSFNEWYQREIVEKGVKLHRVKWTAEFVTVVAVAPEDLGDECSNINIPEDNESEYLAGTFDIVSHEEIG